MVSTKTPCKAIIITRFETRLLFFVCSSSQSYRGGSHPLSSPSAWSVPAVGRISLLVELPLPEDICVAEHVQGGSASTLKIQ